MKLERRHVATALLLAFVAVTAVTLAVKETRHARAVSAAEAARADATPTAAPVLAEVPVPPPAEPAPATEAPAPTPGAVKARHAAPTSPAAPATAVPAEAPSTVVVTYFHATARCASCLRIEDLASSAVATRLAVPLAEKRLVWRLVNVDEPENNHFVRDYGLYTKSVVVSEVKGGREVRWKNLDQVWKLLNDPEGFQSYVEREVRAFLEPA